jgi:hypothetical protein
VRAGRDAPGARLGDDGVVVEPQATTMTARRRGATRRTSTVTRAS